MREALEATATAEGRSLNAEIVGRLEASLTVAAGNAEQVTRLKESVERLEAMLKNTSEGYIELFEIASASVESQELRKLYVLCRARVSSDPEEISALGTDLDPGDEAMHRVLEKSVARAEAQNAAAAAKHKSLLEVLAVQEKRRASVQRSEALADSLAFRLISADAMLPGDFADYPMSAWVRATGFTAEKIMDAFMKAGPKAEPVRKALLSRRSQA